MPAYLGITSTDENIVADLAQMPHLLVGGVNASGKTNFLNTVLYIVFVIDKVDLEELNEMVKCHQRFCDGVQGVGADTDDYRRCNGCIPRYHRHRTAGHLH